MSASPTPAERTAISAVYAALRRAENPTSYIVEQAVYALGAAGMLSTPETAAELVKLRKVVAEQDAVLRRHTFQLADERRTAAARLVSLRASTNAVVAADPDAPVPYVLAVQAEAGDSPAALLAAKLLDSQPDVVLAEVIDPDLLRLHVKPQSLDCWRWWLARVAVDIGSITHRGSYATCRGSLQGVRVLMAGFGVGDLQAAARRDAEAGERS